MEMVNIKINNMPLSVPKGISILEAARMAGIEIPTLCYLKKINEIGACRICMVEVKGARSLVSACVFPVNEGMEVLTNTEKVRKSRRHTLELVLSTHRKECLSCVRSGNCELQKLCRDYGVTDENAFAGEYPAFQYDDSAPHMIRDNSKCVLCRRCIAACDNQAISVIGANARGFDTHIGSPFELPLYEYSCVSCGQCIVNCPVGALYEKDDTAKVFEAIADPDKYVIVNTAPSIRVTLGEAFGNEIGTNVTGKMVAALRRLGFNKVFDTDFSADLTIMEEANELLERISDGGVLPLITSCSPGWVKYCEHYFPEQIDHLSSCKSPQQMFGAVAKTWYAKKMNLDPKDIVVVSIMPCTAKKAECALPTMKDEQGDPDVDVVLTTREIVRMLRGEQINPAVLPETPFDSPLGTGTGAAVVFGATGGVMDAALRSAYYLITGKEPKPDAFSAVRGMDSWKEAVFTIPGAGNVRVAVVSGLGNTRKLMHAIDEGDVDYDFVEVMACSGGCAGGGGQPIHDGQELAAYRGDILWSIDKSAKVRFSHRNKDVQALYREFLKAPLGEKSHHLLHTDHHGWDMPTIVKN